MDFTPATPTPAAEEDKGFDPTQCAPPTPCTRVIGGWHRARRARGHHDCAPGAERGVAPSRGVVHLFLARLLTRTLTAEQVQHHDQHRLPVPRGQGLRVLWHRRLRRLSASGRTRSSGARTASGSGFGCHGLLSVLLLSVVLLPGAFSRHLFLSKRTRPGLRPNESRLCALSVCRSQTDSGISVSIKYPIMAITVTAV